MALTTTGLTNGGITTHFRFQYDDSLALSASNPTGSEPARSNAVIAACEDDLTWMSGLFGGIGLNNISVHVLNDGGGADWNGNAGATTVEIKAQFASYSASPDIIRYLLVAELTETMMSLRTADGFRARTNAARARHSRAFSAHSFLLLTDCSIPVSEAISPWPAAG